jgi:molecular chaperone IbpA
VGFDRLFDRLDNGTRPDWQPYNIEKSNQYRISMALAGFGPDE